MHDRLLCALSERTTGEIGQMGIKNQSKSGAHNCKHKNFPQDERAVQRALDLTVMLIRMCIVQSEAKSEVCYYKL